MPPPALAVDSAVAEQSLPTRLTGESYPIEVSISFSAAWFHWLDSLAGLQGPGMSAGKTIEAHRRTFNRMFGPPDDREQKLLQRFGEIRRRFVLNNLNGVPNSGGAQGNPSALLVAFLAAPDLESALNRARTILDEEDHRGLREILEHFAPKFEKTWDDGKIPHRFLRHLRKHRRLRDLEALLARMAEFFAVDPTAGPPAHLILVPVASGYGTHAQANDRHLLIELRRWDKLGDVASVIVHENAHWLFRRMDEQRMKRLEAAVHELGAGASKAAKFLNEALPTAMGQGVADRMFRPSEWSIKLRWYHIPEIDRYAKRIYPAVEKVLSGEGSFDEAFLRQLLELYNTDQPQPTRQSP